MDNSGLVHPFDEDGKRRAYSDIPKSIEDMKDDPFRSLAGALRRKGGYAKDTTPFSEFLWADFLRRRFKRPRSRRNSPLRSTPLSNSPKRPTPTTFPAGAGRWTRGCDRRARYRPMHKELIF